MERLLAALAKYYEAKGNSILHRIVVNARYDIEEEAEYDNWDGGQSGHGVILRVPPELFYAVMDDLFQTQQDIAGSLNRIAQVEHEHFAWVRLEPSDDGSTANWREDSGLLMRPGPLTQPQSDAELDRIWTPCFTRLFISHKDSIKVHASNLKEALARYGVTAFVAHEDIIPTTEWQREIERALFSMHFLVAMLTDDFHGSNWTDQEVGIAIGRGVPVFSLRMGKDPYGFIGKYQGIPTTGRIASAWADDIVRFALNDRQLAGQMRAGLVTRFERATSFADANRLMEFLCTNLTTAEPEIIARLESAPDHNGELRGAFRVRDSLPSLVRKLRSV